MSWRRRRCSRSISVVIVGWPTGSPRRGNRRTRGVLNIQHFIAAGRAALAESSPELAIKEILERAVSDPSGVEAALGTPRRAEIATLHHERDLTILNVVWAPGMAVYPHDHRMWALIGLYGGAGDKPARR